VDIQDSEDPEGLRVFYYLVQDLRVRIIPTPFSLLVNIRIKTFVTNCLSSLPQCFVFSLISLHFKIKPI